MQQKIIIASLFIAINVYAISCNESQSISTHVAGNLSFEKVSNRDSAQNNWLLAKSNNSYTFFLDSNTRYDGEYSLCMESIANQPSRSNDPNVAYCSYRVEGTYLKGSQIKITAWIKTLNVAPGFCGLNYNTYPSESGGLFKGDLDIKGTNNWEKDSIEFHTSDQDTIISFGALISYANGKIWADDFHVYVNGKELPFSHPSP